MTNKIYFNCDYNEGMHENILKALSDTNLEQTPGYGVDKYSDACKYLIKKVCKNTNLDIHFVSGGTMANLLVISHALRNYQSVICANTGHINNHECGAVEACGRKILNFSNNDGKINLDEVKKFLKSVRDNKEKEHETMPKMIYISLSTEFGTIYSKKELEEIRYICDRYGLYLFIDGARLAYALASNDCDYDISYIAKISDVFYFGGTKIGAPLGEAIVINNKALSLDFRYSLKQRGAMLAKTRIVSISISELLKKNLYLELGKIANDMAKEIEENLSKKNIEIPYPVQTNMIFAIIGTNTLKILSRKYEFSVIEEVDKERSLIRIVTSPFTKKVNLGMLVNDFNSIYV